MAEDHGVLRSKTIPASVSVNAKIEPPNSIFAKLSQPDAGDPSIRVAEFGAIDRLLWDANILFSQGRIEEVRMMAKTAQEKGQTSGYDLSISLLRMDGDKEAFEDMAVEYAVQTGNSPPVWLNAHDKQEQARVAPKRVELKVTSLLMENIIETTIKMETPWPLTLDFSQVTKMDESGVDIFQESLSARISRQESTKIENIDKILNNVIAKIKLAAYEGHEGLWTFSFNCLRLLGNRSLFDELCGDFVEKTGEDLPLWSDLRDPDDINPEISETSTHPVLVGFDVGDSLSEVNLNLLKRLVTNSAFNTSRKSNTPFILNFSSIRRWTIVDMAGVLMLLRQAAKDGIRFEFVNLNEMLFALMKAFAVDKQAKLAIAGSTI